MNEWTLWVEYDPQEDEIPENVWVEVLTNYGHIMQGVARSINWKQVNEYRIRVD